MLLSKLSLFFASQIFKPTIAPANPAKRPKAVTRFPSKSVRYSKSYKIPPPFLKLVSISLEFF